MSKKKTGEEPEEKEEELSKPNPGAIVPVQPMPMRTYAIEIDIGQAKRQMAAIAEFQLLVRQTLKEGHDYGVIPGTPKPTLLKPGAEKIIKLLNLSEDYEIIEKTEVWDDEAPFFRYLIKCTLRDIATGTFVSAVIAETNSKESKWRWRWVPETEIPACIDAPKKATLKKRSGKRTLFEFDFALQKKETTGQYGKPPEYWAQFEAAIKAKTARNVMKAVKSGKEYPGVEIDTGIDLFRVPNDEIFDQVNTLVKMCQKRGLTGTALSVGRLSDLFTQDREDMMEDAAEIGRIIDVKAMEVEDKPAGEAKAPTNGPKVEPQQKTEPAKPAPEAASKPVPESGPAPAAPVENIKGVVTKTEPRSTPKTMKTEPSKSEPKPELAPKPQPAPEPEPAQKSETPGEIPPYIEAVAAKIMKLAEEYGRDAESIIYDPKNGILGRVKRVFTTLRRHLGELSEDEAKWIGKILDQTIEQEEAKRTASQAEGAIPSNGDKK